MSSAGGVTAEQLLRGLLRQKTRLPAEIASFLMLEACEQLLAHEPCSVTLDSLIISQDGALRLGDASPIDDQRAARAVHRDLTSLLVAAGPAPSPGLMRLVEEGPRGGWSLRHLRDDLEASLVPLNRTASRRVLARLVREVEQEQRPGARAGGEATFRDLDSQLSAFLGGDSEPPPPAPREPISSREADATIREPIEEVGDSSGDDVLFLEPDSRLSGGRSSRSEHSTKTVAEARPPGAAPYITATSAAPPEPTRRINHQRNQLSNSARSVPPGASLRPNQSRGVWLSLLFIALAGGLAGATFVLRPEAVRRLFGEEPKLATKKPEPRTAPLPRAGDLVVRVEPERSQVLRFVGRGPVNVEHVPLGMAQEFVAVLDGYAPTRLVLPADAEWERSPQGAQLELAMQLRPKTSEGTNLELGDSLMPAQVGAPQSTLGSVRIVTTPKGAKVYQLVGFAPEARIENLTLDATQELLIYRKGYTPLVRVVAPSDFVANGPRSVADVQVSLTPQAGEARNPNKAARER